MLKHLLLSGAPLLLLATGARASAPVAPIAPAGDAPVSLLSPFTIGDMNAFSSSRAPSASEVSSEGTEYIFHYVEEARAQATGDYLDGLVGSYMTLLPSGYYHAPILWEAGRRFYIEMVEDGYLSREIYSLPQEVWSTLSFDNLGICEMDLVKQQRSYDSSDLVTMPEPYYPDLEGNNSFTTDFYFNPATGKLYIDDRSAVCIAGDFTSSQNLTFENRHDFDLFTYRYLDNGIFCYVPPGLFRFNIQTFNKVYCRIENLKTPASLDLSDGIGTTLSYENDETGLWDSLYGRESVTVPDWQGGDAFINLYMVIPAKAPKIYRYNAWGDLLGAEDEIPSGYHHYEFTDCPGSRTFNQTMYYSLVPQAYYRFLRLAAISPVAYSYSHGIIGDPNVRLSAEGYARGFNFSGEAFKFPQQGYDGSNSFDTDVRIYLMHPQQIRWSVSEATAANLRNVYTIGNPYLNRWKRVFCPWPELPYEAYGFSSPYNYPNDILPFDITRQDGKYAIPDGDPRIAYNNCGYWEGSFKLVDVMSDEWLDSPKAWTLPMYHDNMITIAFDEKNQKLMIHSPYHFDGYFVHLFEDENDSYNSPVFTDIPRLINTSLHRNDAGDIYGEVEVDESTPGLRLWDSVEYGECLKIDPDFDGNKTITDNTTIQVPVLMQSVHDWQNYIKVNVSQPTTLAITIKDTDNPNQKMVHVTASPSGIENVTADAASAAAAPVRYYTLQGVAIPAPVPGVPCLRVCGTTATKILCK